MMFKKSLQIFKISKRQEFVLAVFILGIGLIATQIVNIEFRIPMVVILGILSMIISSIVLREDLHGIEFLTLNILPMMFTVAVAFFYFLLPVRWLTRLPTVVLYMLAMYAILLTENIYNVAAERSIQLLRAAHSVGFLITLVSVFLLYDTVFSFHLDAITNGGLIFIISFPLVLQSLWSMVLITGLSREIIYATIINSLVFAQSAYLLSFWPINTTILSLFLTTLFYSLTGIFRERCVERLFPNTLKEFLGLTLLTFLLVILSTRWG